jgi:hypothetical protein
MTTIEPAPRSQWFGSWFRYSPISLFAVLGTLGGFVGFFLIFGLTLIAAVRQK